MELCIFGLLFADDTKLQQLCLQQSISLEEKGWKTFIVMTLCVAGNCGEVVKCASHKHYNTDYNYS